MKKFLTVISVLAVFVLELIFSEIFTKKEFILILFGLLTLSAMALGMTLGCKGRRTGKTTALFSVIFSAALVFSIIFLFREASDYTFVERDMPFFLPSLIIGVAVAVVILVLLFSKNNVKIKGVFWAKVTLFVAVVFLVCAFVNVVAENLNYVCGDEPWRNYTVRINDKRIYRRSKSADKYCLILEFGEKDLELSVDPDVYYAHESGGAYTFYAYKGAFGVEFYMPKEAENE